MDKNILDEWAKTVNEKLSIYEKRIKNLEDNRFPDYRGKQLEECLRLIDLACPDELVKVIKERLESKIVGGKSYRKWALIYAAEIPLPLYNCI